MQYANYKRKILVLARVLNFIQRYRALLITAGAVLSCALGSFLAVFGIVYDKTPCPSEIQYGDPFTYEAAAFLSDVEYEFSTDSSFESFTDTPPRLVGSYYVRATSKSIFGTDRHGDTHAFSIVPRRVSVGIVEDTLVYGNMPTVTADVLPGHSISCSLFDYSDLTKPDVEVSAIADSIRVTDSMGGDVTAQYSFLTPKSTVSLTKRPITVTVESKEAFYNGLPLQFGGFAVTGGSLADFGGGRLDSIIATFDASIVNAGTLSYLPTTLRIITKDGLDVTDRYDITVVSGTLTVKPRPIILEYNTDKDVIEFEYDGQAHSFTDFKLSDSTPLVEGHSFSVNSYTEITDAGQIPNFISLSFADADGASVDANYYATFVPEGLILRVLKRTLTVRTEDGDWVYDGERHSKEEYSVTEGSLAPDQTHEGSGFAMLTYASTAENTMTLTVRDALGNDVTHNYSIRFDLGTLIVRQRPITVRTATDSWVYDGESHKNHTFEVVSRTQLASGDEGVAISGISLTDYTPSAVDNNVVVDIVRGGVTVTSSYDITYEYGKVSITKRKLSVTTATEEWTYDGGKHAKPEWTYDEGSEHIVSSHIYQNVGYPSISEASSNYTQNDFTISIFDKNGVDKSENYEISYTYGNIRVEPRPITVVTSTNSWQYDGAAHTDGGFKYAQDSLRIVSGHTSVSENLTSVTNVFDGVKQNVYTLKIFEGSVDKSANYDVSYIWGTLEITPRPVSIITGTNEWEYDGAWHSEKTFTYNQGSLPFVSGYDINYIGAPAVRTVDDGIKTNDYSVTVTRGGMDYTSNYTISYLYGTVKIYARNITVLTNTNSWIFDGDAHKDEGFTVIAGSFVAGDTGTAVGALSVTYVTDGVVSNVFTITITNSVGVNMDNNYRLTYVYGNIQIKRRRVDVETSTKSWEYDGEAHSDNTWKYVYAEEEKHFLASHTVTAGEGTKVTNVFDGARPNIFELSVTDSQGNDMSKNYDISYTYGTVKITPRPVSIITATNAWEYDGAEHSDERFSYAENSKEFVSGYEIKRIDTPIVKYVKEGTKINDYSVKIIKGETDYTSNYTITYTYGNIRIVARDITVRTKTAEWIFDGKPHDTTTYEDHFVVISGSLVEGDNAKAVGTPPSVTYVTDGVVSNEFAITITNSVGVNMDNNYRVTYDYGNIQIKRRRVDVKTSTKSWEYDGQAHSDNMWEYVYAEEEKHFLTSHTVTAGEGTKVTNVFDKPQSNRIELSVTDSQGSDMSKNYDIHYTYGTVEITPRPVSIITGIRGINEWKYDGDYHFNYEYDCTEGSFLVGVGDMPVVNKDESTKVRDVGSFDNKIVLDVYRDGQDVTENYKITLEKMGKLTITPRTLYIETPSGEFVYDGKAQFNTEWEYASDTPDRIVEGEVPVVNEDESTKVTNVYEGVVTNELVLEVYRDGEDVTKNYVIKYTKEGTLKINPRPVSIITGTNEWVYDGKAHKEESFTYSEGSLKFVDGQTVTYINAPSVTEVKDGVKDNVFTVSLFGGDEELDRNYDVTYEKYGTVKITPRKISITTGTSEWLYDGLTHSDKTFTYNKTEEYPDEIADGQTADAVGYPEVRFVSDGVVANKFTLVIRDALDKDVSDNYVIDYKAYGTVQIKKSPITLRAEDGLWEFDGEEHKKPEYQITSDRKLGVGDSAVVNIVGSQTEVGWSDNTIASVSMYNSDGDDTTENYDITLIKGELEVVKRKITLTANDKTKVYDGTPLTDDGYRVTSGTVPATHSITSIDVVGTITDVGTVPNKITESSIVIMFGSRNVTDCYEITLVDGELTVTPRKITVTAEDAIKRWDGTPLKNPDYTVGGDGVAPNQTLNCKTEGERTEVGIEKNVIAKDGLTITDALGKDVTENYEITLVDGQLTVLPIATVEVITEGAEKKYDGTPLTCPEYKYIVTDGAIRDGDTVTITVTGTRTEVGVSDNTFTITIVSSKGEDVTRHYDIRESLGKLEVLAREEKDKYFGGTLDGSGDLNTGLVTEGSDNHIVMHLRSEYTGKIYLRYKSFGAYSGKGFLEAEEYTELVYGRFSFNYLTGIAMRNKGAMAYKLIVQPYSTSFVLPYYLTNEEEGYEVQDSDVIYDTVSTGNYSLSHYVYQGYGNDLVGYLGDLEEAELAYREFVKNNYLAIDSETLAFMQTIISGAGLDSSDPRIIEKVRDYICAAATYNDKYNLALNSATNVVTAFLGEYKEGVSQHFAASATMLYRALGIPARYTIGYLAEVKAGEWCELKASSSYAWCEVYVDGVGWITVDVVASGQSIGGESEITKEELLSKYPDISLDLEVRPIHVDKEYDGAPLFASNVLYADGYNALSKLLKLGFTYEAIVAGNRTELGTSESIIGGITIYDPDGNDVTSLFNLTLLNGKIRITKPQIKVELHELSKIYDGNALSYSKDDYTVVYIPEGLRLEFELIGSRTAVGVLDIEELYSLPYRVLDAEGHDVTEDYFLKFMGTGVTVLQREIILTAASEQREYNGSTLTNNTVSITFGELCDGHTLMATAIGQITDVGTVENHVDTANLKIVDLQGNDVTENYNIVTKSGKLTVTEP